MDSIFNIETTCNIENISTGKKETFTDIFSISLNSRGKVEFIQTVSKELKSIAESMTNKINEFSNK